MAADRGLFGPDGTQPPPPPRAFPDPLAGLVTGEQPYDAPDAPKPVRADPEVAVQPPPRPPAQAVRRPPAQATRRPAAGPAARRGAPSRPAAPAPRPAAARPDRSQGATGTLLGCLAVLVVLLGLLFTVLRGVVEAILDSFR